MFEADRALNHNETPCVIRYKYYVTWENHQRDSRRSIYMLHVVDPALVSEAITIHPLLM